MRSGPKSKVQSPKSGLARIDFLIPPVWLLTLDVGFWTLDFGLWTLDSFESVFFPNFIEPLLFAGIVAKHVEGVTLAYPPMQLGKELATLRLSYLWFWRPARQGTERVQAFKMRSRNG